MHDPNQPNNPDDSEYSALPEWSSPPAPHEPPTPGKRSGRAWLGFLAGLAIALLVIGAFAVGRLSGGDDGDATDTTTDTRATDTSAATTTTTRATTTTTAASTTTTRASTTTTTAASTTTTTAASTTSSEPAGPTTTASGPTSSTTAPTPAEPARALARGTRVELRGAVPDQAAADALVAQFSAAVGESNVADELVIDAAAPIDVPVRLRFADVTLFEPGTGTPAADFRPVLDGVVRLLAAQPSIRATVFGHASEQPTPEGNVLLSKQRADSVVFYLWGQGIALDRLTPVYRGADFPVTAPAEESAGLNPYVDIDLAGMLS